jgi:hypothetical protein
LRGVLTGALNIGESSIHQRQPQVFVAHCLWWSLRAQSITNSYTGLWPSQVPA